MGKKARQFVQHYDKPGKLKRTRQLIGSSEKPDRPVKHASSIQPDFHLSSWNQCLVLFFLLNISLAHAVETKQHIKQSLANQNKKADALSMREICTSSLGTFNKPQSVQLGAKNGQLLPLACLGNDTGLCSTQEQLMNNHIVDVHAMNAVYKQIEDKAAAWEKSIKSSYNKLAAGMPEATKTVFYQWITQIWHIKKGLFSMDAVAETLSGTCDQYKNIALVQLITHSLANKRPLNLQVITVHSSTSKTNFKTTIAKPHPLMGHTFIVLGHYKNANIKNDKKAVSDYLKCITQGDICDPWNKVYSPVNEESSGFYGTDAGWDSLHVENINLDFTQLQQLPENAQKFLCRELTRAGLAVDDQAPCRFFATAKKSQPAVYDPSANTPAPIHL